MQQLKSFPNLSELRYCSQRRRSRDISNHILQVTCELNESWLYSEQTSASETD